MTDIESVKFTSRNNCFRYEDQDGNTYLNGVRHSFGDKPAVINGNRMEWYKNDVLHRDGDKPAVIEDTIEIWYQNGLCHRDGDKPAVVVDGIPLAWYKNGKLHRESGPAYIDGFCEEW